MTKSPLGNSKNRRDFLIVGGGIAGLSLAEALSYHSKASITLLEAIRVGVGASTRNAGRLTLAGSTSPQRAAHVRDSRDVWKELQTRLDYSLLFNPLGEVTVLYQETEVETFQRDVLPSLKKNGLKGRIIKPSRIREYVRGYNIDGAVAAFQTPESFVLHHDVVIYGLCMRLKTRGVEILEKVPLENIVFNGNKVSGVIAGGQEYFANHVILCCGDKSVDLLDQMGWSIPMKIVRQQTLVTEPVRSTSWPIVRWTGPESSGSLHRTVRGEVIAACQYPPGDTTRNNGCTADFLTRSARQLYGHLPNLKRVGIIRQWGGLTTITEDHMPYAGSVPKKIGLSVLFGMNAFTMFPLIAKRLAMVLLEGYEVSEMDLYRLSYSRGVKEKNIDNK